MVTQQLTISRDCGKGKFRFVLGHGNVGVFGHVELTVELNPDPGVCTIQWGAQGESVTSNARNQVEKVVSNYLCQYMTQHPELGFIVTLTEVGFDPDRRNDYERAASLALRFALEDMNLPVPQIFGQ